MTTRREFVATAAALLSSPRGPLSRRERGYAQSPPSPERRGGQGVRLPLGFSTLGCPAWPLVQILDFAAAHGYSAVELRGLQATMDLSEAAELAPARLGDVKRQLAERSLSSSSSDRPTRPPSSCYGTRIIRSFRERSSRRTPYASSGATSGTRT